MVFKLASVLREDVVQIYWKAIIEKNRKKSFQVFNEALSLLKDDIDDLQDHRLKEIATNAINWALENPESIYLHTNSNSARAGHLPNMAIFPNLLQGIDLISKKWKRPVREIIHHQQSQFQKILEEWHEMYSKAAVGVINLPLEEPLTFRRVAGSKFIIKNSSESSGIQAIDIVLWLFKKVLQGDSIPLNSTKLMNFVFRFGYQSDLSFDGVGSSLSEMAKDVNSKPFGKKEMENGKNFLEFAEKRRLEAMKNYLDNKQNDI